MEQSFGVLALHLPTLDDYSCLRASVIDLHLDCPYQASTNCVTCSTVRRCLKVVLGHQCFPVSPVCVFQISEL